MKLSVHLPARDAWNKAEEKKYSLIQTKSNDAEEYEAKWEVINTLSEDQFYLLLSDEVTADDYDGTNYWLDRYDLPELTYLVEIYRADGKKTKALSCSCSRPKMYMCAVCGVTRDGINEVWQPLYEKDPLFAEDKEYEEWKHNASASNLIKSTTVPGASSYSYSDGWYEDWGGCRHYGAVIDIQGVKFYASSVKSKRGPDDFVPDFGLYLDDVWNPYWRNEFILWADHGTPVHPVIAFEQILSAVEMAVDGIEVEIGCIGGHGRTGTALACAGVILGMEPEEAIKHVRTAYCKEAIESASQEWYVHWTHAQVTGVDAPPKPLSNWGSYSTPKDNGPTTNVVSSGSVCMRTEHHAVWKTGGKYCNRFGSACRWWEQDIKSFESGWLPGVHDGHPYQDVQTSSGVFRAPKPGRRDKHHNPLRAKGCICDVCRYLDRGFSAFLEPGYSQRGKRETWLQDMAWLDTLEEVGEKKDKLKVLQLNGNVLEINVSPKFVDKTPTKKGMDGDVSGNFIYMMDPQTKEWGWVWHKLARNKILREKKRQEAKETVNA